MNPKEKALFEEVCRGRDPDLVLCTGSRVDVGRWWRTSPVWLCIVGGELVLLAVARRKFLNQVSVEDCQQSSYCHASRTLNLAPTENLEMNHISLSPCDALRTLAILGIHP